FSSAFPRRCCSGAISSTARVSTSPSGAALLRLSHASYALASRPRRHSRYSLVAARCLRRRGAFTSTLIAISASALGGHGDTAIRFSASHARSHGGSWHRLERFSDGEVDTRSRALGSERRQHAALALRNPAAAPRRRARLRYPQPLRARPRRPFKPA